jgi:hypothetical protein
MISFHYDIRFKEKTKNLFLITHKLLVSKFSSSEGGIDWQNLCWFASGDQLWRRWLFYLEGNKWIRRYNFEGKMKNSQLMMPDCDREREKRQNLISPLLLLSRAPTLYKFGCSRAPVLCDRQIFIQKAVILHNLPRFMCVSLCARVCWSRDIDGSLHVLGGWICMYMWDRKREREPPSQSNWGKI